MATMEVSRDLPLRLEFKPDSSYRRGGKHRGMHSILMPTIRETEVAFTVPAHLLGPDQAQLKTAPADRGSFFARGATNSAETMAYYYISALPGSQLVLSSVPDEGTDAPGSETRLSEEGEFVDMFGLSELLEAGSTDSTMADGDTGLQPDESHDAAVPESLQRENSSGRQERFKLRITGILKPRPRSRRSDRAATETLTPSGQGASGCEEVIVKLSAEELDREPVLSSSFCSDYSDDFTAGSSLPSSGRASPSPDARANAAAARLALRELLFGDDCGTNAQAAEGLFDARAKPAQELKSAPTPPSTPMKCGSPDVGHNGPKAWPMNPFGAAALSPPKALSRPKAEDERPMWLRVGLKRDQSPPSPASRDNMRQAICVRSDSAFREPRKQLQAAQLNTPPPAAKAQPVIESTSTGDCPRPASGAAGCEDARPAAVECKATNVAAAAALIDSQEAASRSAGEAEKGCEIEEVVPAVLSEEPKASRSYVVHSLRSIEQLEAEIQQRKHKLDMLVAIHGAWCKALQKPANEHMKLATVTGDDSAHVSSASDSEHSCSSRSSLDSSGDSEYTADMSEMDTRAGGPPPVPVSTVQLPKGRVYTGQLSARKEPHGLGSYELRPANSNEPNADAATTNTYQGEFFAGLMHGFGVYCFADGGWYSGQWTQGRQQGYGQRVFASGTACLGSFGRAGNLNGGGACFYPSGDSYQGEFKAGVPHGRGQHKSADGSTYAGSYAKGRRSGLGMYHFGNGDSFAGAFQEDRPWGLGIYTLAGGERLEAEFEDGRVHGFGIRALPTGLMAAGKWEHGKLLWSRLLRHGMNWEDLADADAEGIDLAQEIARNARHSAGLATTAAAVAQDESSGAAAAIRASLAAAKRAEMLSVAAARIANRN